MCRRADDPLKQRKRFLGQAVSRGSPPPLCPRVPGHPWLPLCQHIHGCCSGAGGWSPTGPPARRVLLWFKAHGPAGIAGQRGQGGRLQLSSESKSAAPDDPLAAGGSAHLAGSCCRRTGCGWVQPGGLTSRSPWFAWPAQLTQRPAASFLRRRHRAEGKGREGWTQTPHGACEMWQQMGHFSVCGLHYSACAEHQW